MSDGPVDIGEIRVQPQSNNKGQESLGEYTLINVSDGRLLKRDYRPDQSIGAIVADLRREYNLGLNDNIIISLVVNGARQELLPETRVSQLTSKELYWEIRKYT